VAFCARHPRHRVGHDCVRAVSPHTETLSLPVHVHLLVDQGIFIMEALDLEPLAADRVTECGFVALPLKLVGVTGSPIRPIAIV
jgi:kynurenine formamidase